MNTHVTNHIRWAINRLVYRIQYARRIHIKHDVACDEIVNIKLQEPAKVVETKDLIDKLFSVLTPRQRLVVTEYYLNNLTLSEIGQIISRTRECVRLNLQEAMIRLRHHARRIDGGALLN